MDRYQFKLVRQCCHPTYACGQCLLQSFVASEHHSEPDHASRCHHGPDQVPNLPEQGGASLRHFLLDDHGPVRERGGQGTQDVQPR